MSYSTDHLRTAGKITVYTTLIGVVAFAIVFIFNLGEPRINEAVAQDSATTTVVVVNTPPYWTASSTEVIESSATNPTNAGDVVSWTGIGTDSNGERYYLLICSTNATPTAQSLSAPLCGAGAIRWAVSASTTSGAAATAATTTLSSWSESNPWFAYVCDGNSANPRCSSSYTQGTNATNSSPFEVNHRPLFSIFTDDSPAAPGATVTFTSSSTDTDVSGTPDTVRLFVCATAGFSTSTDTCTGTTLASSTALVASNATAQYTIVIPTQDTNYSAFGYVIDNHGFESADTAQGTDSTLTVSNVAPSASSTTISINGGSDLVLTVESAETTGFTLSFVTADNNSCDAVGGGTGDEITGYQLSLYRSGIGSTTCSVTGPYNANYCYPSSLATTTWNLSCTASTTSCTGNTDTTMQWDCTFPLWYIADPTDGVQGSSTQYGNENWKAQVQAIDNNNATGSPSEGTIPVEVQSFLAFALNDLSINYGSLEPGQQTDPITATTTLSATGNVGIDTRLSGESMCTTYSGSSLCPNLATSTIPESEQVYGTSTVTYAQGVSLSSTTANELELNVHKSTATSTATSSNAYWGIRVPSAITFAGSYTGENTFIAIVGESVDW